MNDPERLDLTSASGAHARRRCLGQTALIRHLRATGKLNSGKSSKDAEFGNGIHAAWAGQDVKLDHFQAETLEKMKRLEALLVVDWAAGREAALFAREVRLWLHKGIIPIHSGQYDVAYVTQDLSAMLIIDGKTLMSPVAPADTNDQLRELVALAHFNYPAVQIFTVAIIQPHVELPTSIATYDALEAELALRLLYWHLKDIEADDLPRIYGPWCKYCPAIEFCPEARNAIEPVLAYQFESVDSKLTLPVGEAGSAFLRRLMAAKGVIETLTMAYKAFLEENNGALPGWTLKPGRSKRGLTDVRAAYEALQDVISLEEFLACANVSVTKLQSAAGVGLGLKGKSLKQAFDERLGDVITWKQDAPSLEDQGDG